MSNLVQLAIMKKDKEKYVIYVDVDNSTVMGEHFSEDGFSQMFNRGKRASVFVAVEHAKKLHIKMESEGWHTEEVSFTEAARMVFKNQAKEMRVAPKKKVAKRKNDKPVKPEYTISQLLSMPPALLAKEAISDLGEVLRKKEALENRS